MEKKIQNQIKVKRTCLSFCNCFVIASLRFFWLFVSSVPSVPAVCFELADPKQPIADHEAHQQVVAPPSGEFSGDSVVPLGSPPF